jgi:hypothetical protein
MTPTNDRNQIPAATVTTWEIDPKASRVEFTTRMRLMLLMKVKVQGRFTDVSGTLTVDEREPANSQVIVTIGTASLEHLSAGGRGEAKTHLQSHDGTQPSRLRIDLEPSATEDRGRGQPRAQYRVHPGLFCCLKNSCTGPVLVPKAAWTTLPLTDCFNRAIVNR